ncbi:hypothetical protein Enr13x_27480 [Stieleria neptunia]|uniref:Uncharacterized protein n=1 Tax=Stieleria neptunia TaxID=2527979 RepID=A0A518HQ30_9BACT|nr:hypothetical protein [Stieleria neptunia]QDV42897.1 hypothetical protein Enr13x_27480 [Stieleria neptunia]
MDQVKEYLAVAIKHGFWIGSSIVLIGALAVWYLSTSDLNEKTESQIRKIEGDVQKVTQYRSELSTQPNDLSHQWMNEKIDIRKEEVLQAWQNVFDAQRHILTWPDKLKDDFLIEFKYVKDPETGIVDRNTLKLPFEKYELFPPSSDPDQVNPELLRRYEQYIGETLPSYAEIAGAEWTADFSKRGAGMGASYGMDEMMMGTGRTRQAKINITGAVEEPVVIWSTSSQETVLKDLFPWRGVKDYPSELDVYYSQENLWILKQLLQIVAAVNGGAQQSFEAEIREIKNLSIGKSVTFNQGSISDPGSRATAGFGGGMGMDDMEGYGDMDMYEMDSMMSGGTGGIESEGADPGDSRYVNTANEPIDAASLRSAFSSNDPGQVAIAVAKRVPVMMHLQMNQQSIARLLAACGSAPLMVDVRQVRVMPKGGSTSGGGGGGGYGDMMGMGMEDEMMGGMGMGDMSMGGMGGMGGGASVGAPEDYPMDMEVEIYGLIYFYNPPSEESLGIEKVKDDVSIDESAEVIDALPGPTDTEPTTTAEPPTATPPATEPPATTPPAAVPPADTPPAATPPADTPPADTPPAATPPAATPPAATPPTAMAIPVAIP